MGLTLSTQHFGLDLPMMKQMLSWSRGKENGRDGASAGVGESGVWRKAWPEGRVSSRSAFRTLAASLLGHNGCTQPGRNHHGQGRDQILTCL